VQAPSLELPAEPEVALRPRKRIHRGLNVHQVLPLWVKCDDVQLALVPARWSTALTFRRTK
jgi:hypothetical protein